MRSRTPPKSRRLRQLLRTGDVRSTAAAVVTVRLATLPPIESHARGADIEEEDDQREGNENNRFGGCEWPVEEHRHLGPDEQAHNHHLATSKHERRDKGARAEGKAEERSGQNSGQAYRQSDPKERLELACP